ncbi:MAG: L-histidine N(alpha)-methyltransferase [Bacteroidetes bacterium]|nr:MAG: L-histidine N(alpha)-methyltransferase [Bacteroidota bacterium]
MTYLNSVNQKSETLENINYRSFLNEVLKGLSSSQKFLSSKYFYDDAGSRLFEKIMQHPDYYLTNCEHEIFDQQKNAIKEAFYKSPEGFNMIDLGSGDGYKTKILLEHFCQNDVPFRYVPIDISEKPTIRLVNEIKNRFPNLKVEEQIGDYFQIMSSLNLNTYKKKIVLFLGSNIGNYGYEGGLDFFITVRKLLTPGDKLFIGFDLKKDPQVILNAYNDKAGYTKEFNLNLLRRINRELHADFNISSFIHYPVYDPKSGAAKSYLVSTKKQKVSFRGEDISFEFDKWEPVFMEISQKYDLKMIQDMATMCGFKVQKNFFDNRNFFVNSLWEAVK